MNQSWSFIVFGFNECKTLPSVVADLCKFIKENEISDYEINIIDDGSTDDTEIIAGSIKEKDDKIIYKRHEVNLGIGPTLVDGYSSATAENVIAIPADGQFDVNELKEYINFPNDAFLSFFRELNQSYSAYRKFISSVNKFINKNFLHLKVKDVNWVKAYKSSELKEISLKIRSSLVCSEICAKLNLKGINAIEIRSVYHSRTAGKSKGASLKTIIPALKDVVKLITEIRKFKKKIN